MLNAQARIQNRANQFMRKMRNVHRHMLQAGANFLVDRVKANISVSGPPASVPGEYPHVDTGDLKANVHAKVNARRALVISDLDYSEAVEDKRPFMQRTYEESKKELYDVMIASGRRVMGGGP